MSHSFFPAGIVIGGGERAAQASLSHILLAQPDLFHSVLPYDEGADDDREDQPYQLCEFMIYLAGDGTGLDSWLASFHKHYEKRPVLVLPGADLSQQTKTDKPYIINAAGKVESLGRLPLPLPAISLWHCVCHYIAHYRDQRLSEFAALYSQKAGGFHYQNGEFIFKGEKSQKGQKGDFTSKEGMLLALFALFEGKALSRDFILKHVFGYQDGVSSHTLETHIYRLRQKLAGAACHLQTTAGGYCWQGD